MVIVRLTLLWCCAAEVIWSAHWSSAQAPASRRVETPSPGLVAEHTYNGISRPCIVTVVSPRSFGTITLALMDNDGNALAPAAQAHAGRVDLAEASRTTNGEPITRSLERAAWPQMIAPHQP